MKIKYEFVTETTEIEVEDEWATVIADLDRLERNNDKKEKRRHYSLDACTYEGEDYAMEDSNILALFNDNEEHLYKAMDKLSIKQRNLVRAVFFDGMSISDYADINRVSQPAISQQLKTIYKKLKKFL